MFNEYKVDYVVLEKINKQLQFKHEQNEEDEKETFSYVESLNQMVRFIELLYEEINQIKLSEDNIQVEAEMKNTLKLLMNESADIEDFYNHLIKLYN